MMLPSKMNTTSLEPKRQVEIACSCLLAYPWTKQHLLSFRLAHFRPPQEYFACSPLFQFLSITTEVEKQKAWKRKQTFLQSDDEVIILRRERARTTATFEATPISLACVGLIGGWVGWLAGWRTLESTVTNRTLRHYCDCVRFRGS